MTVTFLIYFASVADKILMVTSILSALLTLLLIVMLFARMFDSYYGGSYAFRVFLTMLAVSTAVFIVTPSKETIYEIGVIKLLQNGLGTDLNLDMFGKNNDTGVNYFTRVPTF